MNSEKEPTGPNKTETLFGGIEWTLTRTDGSTERVRIRQLPVKLFPAYAEALLDEPKMVELLCDRPAGWSETIGIEDFEQIIVEGRRLNADFFGRWAARRQASIEALMPGASQRALDTAWQKTSPSSPSPAGTA